MYGRIGPKMGYHRGDKYETRLLGEPLLRLAQDVAERANSRPWDLIRFVPA